MPFLPIHDDNPRRWIGTPYVGWSLILSCVIVSIWQAGLTDLQRYQVAYGFGFTPAVFFEHARLAPALAAIPPEATTLTTLFLHGGAWHLIGNMLYLYIFGDNVEDSCGHIRFLAFYLACGVLATLAHGYVNPTAEAPLIGASGAISGVLGGYLLLRPKARITALLPFFLPVRMPVWAWIGGWFLYQAIASGGGFGPDNVAYAAHIGGFVAGVCLIPFFKRSEARLFDVSD